MANHILTQGMLQQVHPCVNTEHPFLPFWTETFLSLCRGEAGPTSSEFSWEVSK